MVDPKTWQPQPKIYKHGPYTVEVPGTKKIDGETRPRRNARCKDGLIMRPEPDVATIFDIVKRGASKFGNAKCLGHRAVVRTHEEVKKVKKMVDGKEEMVDKKWTFTELGPYTYMTFNEYERLVLDVGAGLRDLGMVAQDRLHIFAATRSVIAKMCLLEI